jgi:hypothetical protein
MIVLEMLSTVWDAGPVAAKGPEPVIERPAVSIGGLPEARPNL